MSFLPQIRRFSAKASQKALSKVVESSLEESPKQAPQKASKRVQVAILGADTCLGENFSFLLNQNKDVSLLHLQGICKRTDGIGVDLSHITTKSIVYTYYGKNSIVRAIRSSDAIFLLAKGSVPTKTTFAERIMAEAPRVVEIAKMCSKYAPKAVIVVCVQPISVFVPMIREIFKRDTNWYHPGRIVGSAAFPQIKANSITARYLNLDPQSVFVPIIGGPDLDCCVPLFSKTTPINIIGKDAENLLKQFKCDDIRDDTTGVGEAFALNKMATAIALGLKEIPSEYTVFNTFVRSNIIKTCKHVLTSVQFGKTGVEHNFGIPRLSKAELSQFEKVTLLLKEREFVANEYLDCEKDKEPGFLIREKAEAELLRKGIVR